MKQSESFTFQCYVYTHMVTSLICSLQESVQATEDSLLPPVEEVSGNTQTGDSSADGVNESVSVALAGANKKQVPNPSVTEYNFLKFKNSFLEVSYVCSAIHTCMYVCTTTCRCWIFFFFLQYFSKYLFFAGS